MRIIIESTDEMLLMDDVPVRRWKGTTEGGHVCTVYTHRITVALGPGSEELATVLEKGTTFEDVMDAVARRLGPLMGWEDPES